MTGQVPPRLSLRGVRKSYWRGEREIPVLDDVSLDLHAGEVVAVWGMRRSGKSTLLRVAAGLEAPDRGAVLLDGRDLAGTRRARRPQRGRVAWISGTEHDGVNRKTVMEHILRPLLAGRSSGDALRLANGILEQLDLIGHRRARWESLSDGERTLVALARALASEPAAIVADDLTIDLGVIEGERVYALLREAAREQGLCVLSMTSEMADAAGASYIAALSDGRVIVPGAPPDQRGAVVDFLSARQQSA